MQIRRTERVHLISCALSVGNNRASHIGRRDNDVRLFGDQIHIFQDPAANMRLAMAQSHQRNTVGHMVLVPAEGQVAVAGPAEPSESCSGWSFSRSGRPDNGRHLAGFKSVWSTLRRVTNSRCAPERLSP